MFRLEFVLRWECDMSWINPESRFIWNSENSYNQISLSVWGIPTSATAEEERDVPSCHRDRVALWRSPITADEVTHNCFEKTYAQFCSFTMAVEEHLDLNKLFEEPLLEAFRYCTSFAFCRRKRPMKSGSSKSFYKTHTFWWKSLHQKFTKV